MNRRRAELALIVATMLWGFSAPAIKAALAHVSPMLGVALRFGLAGLLLTPTLRGITAREIRAGIVIGTLFALGVALQNVGLDHTTASRSGFLVAVAALLTPVVGTVALGTPVTPAIIVRLVIALGGVFLLSAPGGSLTEVNKGDWLTMIAAVFFAGHVVAVGHYSAGSSIRRILSIQFLMTSAVGFGMVATVEVVRWVPSVLLFALLGFLCASALVTFGLQLRGQQAVSANEAALIFTMEPLVAAATAYLTLGERLSLVQILGGVIILAAVGWPGRDKETTEPVPGLGG